MNIMASSITAQPAEISATTKEASPSWNDPAFVSFHRDRHISFKAARGLEIIGHAIEYLSDDSFRDATSGPEDRAHLEAVRMLMSLNREIYLACPPAQTFQERLHSFLRLHRG